MTNTGMNKGLVRKERRTAALVCTFLSVLLLACLLTGVAAAESKVIDFASDGKKLQIEIDYDENVLFSPSATGYNLKLAQASLAMAAAAFSSGAEYADYGPDAAKARYKNLKAAYEKLGFSEMEFHNYDKPLNVTEDYVAYGIAEKTITLTNTSTDPQTDEQWTLFAVQVRGSGYAGEWVSNFHIDPYNIDDVDYSKGFGTPAKEIYDKLKEKIEGIQSPGEGQPKKVKIWISGFSRAAAVSNALGGELTRNADALGLSKDNIYAYTFATPNDVLRNSSENVENYTNIHNTLNPCDIVPVVPMSVTWYNWNYSKYGQTHYFNYGKFTDEERSQISEKYKEITGDGDDPYTPTSNTVFLPVLFELCLSQTITRDGYINDFYPYVEEIMSLVFCGDGQDAARLLALNNNLDLLHPGDENLAVAKEMTKEYSEENEELDEKVLRFIVSRALEILWLFSDDTNNAVSNRASNSSDERQGPIAQFTDGVVTVGFYQKKTWYDSNAALTTTAKLVDNLIAEISALKKSGYNIKNITTLTSEHKPEVYMSVLFSGISEGRLFTNPKPLDNLHAIVYDTKGGKLDDGKYVEIHLITEDPVDLSDKIPTKDGYVFSEWVDEEGEPITKVVVSEPGYTRVTAMWKQTFPIDDGTAKIDKWNIDTITLLEIDDGSLIVKELSSPELSDGSISVSAITMEYEPELPENLLLTAPAELSDSNLQDYDTSAVIYFSILEETAEYLAELSPSYDIINHPELGVLKYLDSGVWYNLETEYDGMKYDEDGKLRYRYYAYTDHLSLDDSFSFAICVNKFIPKKRSSSSSSQGTSIWLTAAPTPEPTPEPTPTPTIEPPAVVPLNPVTQTPQSPVPFAGIAAGFFAAAVLLWMRRR
ncbi:MAG: hypothetical protein Q4Q20_06150 [Methanocorpusculum sp.]|nr:hypothetical protein [Methanocorpusculum sp.]